MSPPDKRSGDGPSTGTAAAKVSAATTATFDKGIVAERAGDRKPPAPQSAVHWTDQREVRFDRAPMTSCPCGHGAGEDHRCLRHVRDFGRLYRLKVGGRRRAEGRAA